MCVISSPDPLVPSLMFLFSCLTPVERVSIYTVQFKVWGIFRERNEYIYSARTHYIDQK